MTDPSDVLLPLLEARIAALEACLLKKQPSKESDKCLEAVVTANPKEGVVRIEFTQHIKWMEMSMDAAMNLANKLIEKASEL